MDERSAGPGPAGKLPKKMRNPSRRRAARARARVRRRRPESTTHDISTRSTNYDDTFARPRQRHPLPTDPRRPLFPASLSLARGDMPLVATVDGGELPLPASSTQMGRAVCRRLGIDADADKFAVSRVQCEVSVMDDGAGLRVTSLGTNPTPWFPAAENHARRILAKGESATLHDGDGLGLVQTEPSPGNRVGSGRRTRTRRATNPPRSVRNGRRTHHPRRVHRRRPALSSRGAHPRRPSRRG